MQPIYLYALNANSPINGSWNYTSFAAPVWSNGVEYVPFAMSHGALADNSQANKYTLEIEAEPNAEHPFSLFFPFPFPGQLQIEVMECSLDDPDTATTLFTGIVRSVEDQGNKYIAKCCTQLYLLERKLPRWLIQPVCNNVLFDVNCGIVRAAQETSVVIAALNNDPLGPSVTCTLAWPAIGNMSPSTANFFANGIFETGYGTEFEPRTILASSWDDEAEQLTYPTALFQYAVFYNGLMEFTDCAPLTNNAPVQCNSNIYVGSPSGSTLTFNYANHQRHVHGLCAAD